MNQVKVQDEHDTVNCDEVLNEVESLQDLIEKLLEAMDDENEATILAIVESLAGTLRLLVRILRDCIENDNGNGNGDDDDDD